MMTAPPSFVVSHPAMSRLVQISEAASLGLHTMAFLAREGGQRFTTEEIAARLHASGHHLAKVMQRLVRASLVDSLRGPLGGFQLAWPAEQTKLLEIYEAIEGPLTRPGCLLSRPVCDGTHPCVLGDVVREVQHLVENYLSETTLADLALGAAFLRN